MRFTSKLSMGEIRHQHIQAPLAAAIRPFAISPSTLMSGVIRPNHNTGNYMPYMVQKIGLVKVSLSRPDLDSYYTEVRYEYRLLVKYGLSIVRARGTQVNE